MWPKISCLRYKWRSEGLVVANRDSLNIVVKMDKNFHEKSQYFISCTCSLNVNFRFRWLKMFLTPSVVGLPCVKQ